MKIVKLIFFIYCFYNNFCSAQNDTLKSPKVLGIRLHYGFIIPHSESIKSISKSNPYGFEVDYSHHLIDEETWQYCFCYPRVGLTFAHFSFDNTEILGTTTTLSTFIEPFFTNNPKFNFSLRAGAGVAYLDNPYDEKENPQNLFYSSNISFIALLNIALNYQFNRNVNLRLAGYYNHISNGGVSKPNKGINFPTLSLGIDYNFSPVEFISRKRLNFKELHEKRKIWQIAIFLSSKEDKNIEENFLVYGISGKFSYIISRLSALNLGLETAADNLEKRKSELDPNNITNGYADHKTASFLLGHDLLLGRFTFSQQIGIYLYKYFKTKDEYYQRWELSYKLCKRFLIAINLKAHRQVADFMDFRVGIRF